MGGTDHFVFTFTNQNTNEQTIKNYQPAPQYLVGNLELGVVYTLTVSPYVNGITYPASPPTDPFSISAISEKNVELQGVTLSGGDSAAYISFTGAIPAPPIALAVSNIAIDDNFINYQLRCNLGPSPPRPVNTGTVFIGNLTNGSSYTFTVTPYTDTNGIFEYGRSTTLPPYIPGPPSDLYINSITANTTTAFLNTTYDTLVHPIPVSNIVDIWESTFTTICSLVSLPSTVIQDSSQTYAGFTTLSSLFTAADITYLKSTVSANPGIVQIDITDNTGLWYSFPLASVSGGGIGYVFENSNFTKTQSLYTTASSSSYTLLFRQVNLLTQICSLVYSPPQTAFTYNGVLNKANYTFVGRNFANGLPSLRTAYATVAVGEALFPTNITGVSGNHIVSISFTGYDPTRTRPGPRPTKFRYSDNYGNTYTTINSNIVINGLTDSSLYTFTIAGFGNGVYGNTADYSITPNVRPPTSLSVVVVSNYDVTLSFTPALGGADFYTVVTQNGLAESASAYPYKIQGLSANISYFFGALSYAYTSVAYSILSSVSANLIQEVSSSYAQFLISPSGFPYASNIQRGRTEFVPYLYTITAGDQGPAPPTVDVNNFVPANIFPVGTSLYASNSISTIALVQSGILAGSAYTVTTSGKISYTLTSIGLSGNYYVLNGGPSTLSSLSGQILSLSITPISSTLTFPVTSVTSIYDGNGNITAYNIQNPDVIKSKVTFSGATIYNTTISAIIPFYDGMMPTTFMGTVSSSTFTPAGQNPTYVGPPGRIIFTASSYSSQRIELDVTVSGSVTPSFYAYTEVSGKVVPGTSVSSHIVLSGLTNGSSYTFSVKAFGNQVYGLSAQTKQFDLCTNAPQNVVASFFNTTPIISFQDSIPAATTYVCELYNGTLLDQSLTQVTTGTFQFPKTVVANTKWKFTTYGILNGISSTACNILGVIAGPPFKPDPVTTLLSSGQIVFNWSSGNTDYSEKFRITEYLSNNGVYPTGGVWSNISGLTYTVSAVVSASGTQGFATSSWIEIGSGYASFVLSNDSYPFLSTISSKYVSNQIYLTFQQSGGVSYTFPLTNSADYNSQSNIYTNPNYPKDTTDIFNPALTLSVTYSYGTGPFNYGKYLYTLDSFANQVYGLSAERTAQMFVQPVNGIPTVSVISTTATVSFAQSAITGAVYRVRNNYGSNVSAPPYAFTNLLTGRPYTFSVVVSNGSFISISSASNVSIYVGPPSVPTVSTSYYGQTSTVYVTDTTLSLASIFFDSGKQGTGSNVRDISHTNVIQQTSGGFWVVSGSVNGNIKDTLSGFVSSDVNIGSAAYSNDGTANVMYQFTVTPSTGTMAVSLSSYSLFISGTALAVSNGSTQVYSANITASSYPIQFISRPTAFAIQSGLSSFLYTSIPASSDVLTISLGGAASFFNFRVYSLNNVGVPASSYKITDQFTTVYNPILAYTVYSLSGITYAYNLFNVAQNADLTLSATPSGNGVEGPAGTASLYINTAPPSERPFITSLVDTSATVTVVGVTSIPPIEFYSLIQYENEVAISTQTQPAVSTAVYTFKYPNLTNHSNYYFRAYTTRFGVSSVLTESSLKREAGHPYPFPTASGLSASLLNNPDSATTGTYTLSATLKVGANSNGNMTVYVYSGNTQIASSPQTVTITTSADQQYSFTVSGGAVYTLSTAAILNSVTQIGPTTTISAVPFSPLGVSLTISTSDLGSTYGGIINVTAPSPTTGVTYYYAYSSNNGATVTALSQTNIFNAFYGANYNYIGYVYSCNVAPLNLLSTTSASTIVCNIFLSPPSNAIATYTGTNITVNWSGNTIGSYLYTVRETGGKLGTKTNISTPPLSTTFVGTTGSSYTFEVAAQSDVSRAFSVIYSKYTAPTTTINLTSQPVTDITINYFGKGITLNWTNLGSGYVYTVSQTVGPYLGNFGQPAQGIPNMTIDNVPPFNTYQFTVSTSLNGFLGAPISSPQITLSTAALTNITQSYTGVTGSIKYTISWNAYTPLRAGDTSIAYYVLQDVSGNSFTVSGSTTSLTSLTTSASSAVLKLPYTVSSYTFQVNASYKGILGPTTTLSAIYTYVNAPPFAPITTYSNSNITVSWSAAAQPDGNSKPDTYFVYDTIGQTLSSNVLGTVTSVNLTATVGLSYQFTVTSIYNRISSGLGPLGNITRVYTPPPTNVVVTNSGSNLYITWTSSINSPSATYYIQQLPPTDYPVMPSGFVSVLPAENTSYTSPSAVTTLSDKILYNFQVRALSNGLSSDPVSGISPAFVYTYPVTNVFIYYSNTTLFAGWTSNINQPNATFNATPYLKGTTTSVGSGVNTESGVSSINIGNGVSNYSYYAKVYAVNNNLRQSDSEDTRSLNDVYLYTAAPIFNGIGFNGTYAITVNISYGPDATDYRLQNADTYTLTEINRAFFPSNSAWTLTGNDKTSFTIPALGARGVTYNFSLFATLCGLPSIVANPGGTISLPLITNPVPAGSVVATYSGTLVTVSWGAAVQNNIVGTDTSPNGGYTVYVSSLPFPYVTQYKLGTSLQFVGDAGGTYQFSVEATNNNVGSALVTDASAIVTLYKPVVQFLNVTNSGQVTASGNYYAKMILTWLSDSTNAPNATYTGTAFNRGTGQIEGTGSTTSNTMTFNGSLGYTYNLTVTGNYKGINGNSSTVQISNARPILTVEPLINVGNIITVNYSANEAYSTFDVSVTPTNGGSVISNIVSTNAYSSWRVTTSTGGFGYNVSTTAFFNGIPSTTIGRTITLTEPAAPSSITFRYNNALVSVSWSPVTTNASSYTFTAYDLSADPPILTSSQPGLLATSTSFLGIIGHTYNVSAFALSSNNITSRAVGTISTLVIPPAPSGSLILSNAGTLVSVSWTTSAGYGYAFYVSNIAQKGTIIYSNQFALPGDTFSGVIGETYSVSLFQISPCNITSVASLANTWKVYQPYIPFASFTNIGRDNTVTWPQDIGGCNCTFLLRDNYTYSNLLTPSAYTQIGSYISYTVTTPSNDSGATNAGRAYIYSVVPSWNGVNGNTVYTDTQSPIRLYKPTAPGALEATGQGNSFTLNWQSAVIWTSPATIIPSYLVQVAPTTVSATYPVQSFNVIGNTQTVNGFDNSAGALTISLTAVSPVGYINPIYGNTANLTYTVPSGNTVSITQSTTNAETLIVTVPVRSVGSQYTWFYITGTGSNGQSTTAVSNYQTYNTTSSNYNVTVSLGYYYTISAFLTTTTSPPTPADPSAPANPNPFPAKTLNVSGITVTHDACTVTLIWSPVAGAEKYYVRTNNNGQPASGKFGKEYPSTTTSITITDNGGSPTEQFASNAIYSYIVQAYTLSTNQFRGSSVRSCNILSDIATSANVQMYIPTNPTVAQLILTQSYSNIIASWPALTSYPQDNLSDLGTASYTISCTSFTSITTTGTTATFGSINPGTLYTISLNTKYKGFWGAIPTTNTIQTTVPTITSGPTLTDTGSATIRVTASAATAGFWYLGTALTLMNSPATVASNSITYTFPSVKATTYTCNVKFVTQDTGLSVTSNANAVSTPSLVVSTPTTADAGATRRFSIALAYTGTPTGGIVWDIDTPTGTTFLSGDKTVNNTTLYYQFTNAAWSTGLVATFTTIVLSNDGFVFYPFTGGFLTFTPPNLNIPTPTLANSGGNLVLSATTTGGYNVNWFWPSYNSVAGTGTTPATTLSVNYGTLGNTGTTFTAGGALSLAFNGYTNAIAQANLPSFTAPTFGFGTITFADPNNTTKTIRLTANYGTYSAGTTAGTTTPQWTFPSTTSNGGGYYQLTTTGTLTPTTSPATLDYSTTQNGSNYAIAANAIRLTYQGVSISYGSLLTASSPNIAVIVNGTYSGTTLTVTPTNAAGVAGNWSLGTITPGIPGNSTTPLNIETPVPGGATDSTITVTVIGAGGGGGNSASSFSFGGLGGDGAVATYTFTGVALGTTISYYIGGGGGGGYGNGTSRSGGGGGNYSYIRIGTTTIYAAGGGGGGNSWGYPIAGSSGVGSGGGAVAGAGGAAGTNTSRNGGNGGNGTISTNPAAATGTRVGTYGKGGNVNPTSLTGSGSSGNNGLIAITMGNYGYTITQTPANPTAAPTITITPATVGTTYTVPVNFSYNSGQFTSTGSTSITVTSVAGTAPITGATFTYATANDTTPNGFNVTYTVAGFTGSSSTPAAVGCTTPVTLDANYNNISPILVQDTTNNANVQKGNLNTNVVYRLNATESVNGNLGSLSTWDAVMPGAVTNVKWGSTAGGSDNALATSNTIWISWTPISVDAAIASQFTYSIYSNTTLPNRPSTTSPTTAVTGYTGLVVGTSNVQFTIPTTGSQTYFIVTKYSNSAASSYYSAASAVVKFTYGFYIVPNATSSGSTPTTFTQTGANTYLVAKLCAGIGGQGSSGSSGAGAYGGLGASWTYDGTAANTIKSGYNILFVPGTNGGNGVRAGVGGNGGSGYGGGGDGDGSLGLDEGGGGGGGGGAGIVIKDTTNAETLKVLLTGGGGGGGGSGYDFSAGGRGGDGGGEEKKAGSGGARGAGGNLFNNGSTGGDGGVNTRVPADIGSVGNAPLATSTCKIYYVVPNV
jgi:hypothetical protein